MKIKFDSARVAREECGKVVFGKSQIKFSGICQRRMEKRKEMGKRKNPQEARGRETAKHGANGQVNKLENVPQRPTLPLMAST